MACSCRGCEDDEELLVKTIDKRELRIQQIKGTIYGHCIGDAIGLLTEFMTKDEAARMYKKALKRKRGLQYGDKVPDFHRSRWEVGDWTDDSDQMILIMQSILEHNGSVIPTDVAKRLADWRARGFPELGDMGGMGIGQTTVAVLMHSQFLSNPHKASNEVWETGNRYAAANGAVMRTSILGINSCMKLDCVISSTVDICKVTHADPRCIASCVAVTTAISIMLQRNDEYCYKDGSLDIKKITQKSIDEGSKHITDESHLAEFKFHMNVQKLQDLELSCAGKIGYTLKTLGAGFWALRQRNFRTALTAIIKEAGDADTNGAVAGALLGCKLSAHLLPDDWLDGLKHKQWLDEMIDRLILMIEDHGMLNTDKLNNEQSSL